MVFYPLSSRWLRGVNVVTFTSSTTLLLYVLIACDFGRHEHVFSGFRRYIVPKIDAYFDVDEKIILGLNDRDYSKYLNDWNEGVKAFGTSRAYSAITDATILSPPTPSTSALRDQDPPSVASAPIDSAIEPSKTWISWWYGK